MTLDLARARVQEMELASTRRHAEQLAAARRDGTLKRRRFRRH